MEMKAENISIHLREICGWAFLALLMVLLLPGGAQAAVNYTTNMISSPLSGIIDRNPVIDNTGRVAWEQKWTNPDGWSYSYGIHQYNGSTHTVLGDPTHRLSAPALSDTGELVWRDETAKSIQYRSGGTTQSIGTYMYTTTPAISRNGQVSWFVKDQYDTNDAFKLYDHGTTKTSPTMGYFDTAKIYYPYGTADGAYAPKVNNQGKVVWMGGSYAKAFETVQYNSQAGTITDMSNRSSLADMWPDLNDNGEIVWYGVTDYLSSGSPWHADLFYYDGSTVQSITGHPVSTSGGYSAPLINNNGQIAYVGPDTDPGGTDLEVFLYEIATGTTTQITHDANWQPFDLSLNDSGQLAWVGKAMDLSTDDEVFVWDGSVVQQLTNDDGNALNTSINNLGQVVWENYDTTPSNSDWEIWLATPTAVPEPGSLLLITSGIALISLRRSRMGA